MTLEVRVWREGHRGPLSSWGSCWRSWGLLSQGPRHVLLPQGWFSLASCLTLSKWWWKWREQVHEMLEEVRGWATRETTSLKELQVLLGKLHFVWKCVRQGGVFVSWLLNLLHETSEHGVKSVSEEARADIRWFKKFLPEFNGVALIPNARWSESDAVLATDACLVGCGGVCEEEFFQSEFPVGIAESACHISALEMLTVAVAVRIWGHRLGRAKIKVYWHNEATVDVVNSGKTRDPFLQRVVLCNSKGPVYYPSSASPRVQKQTARSVVQGPIPETICSRSAQIRSSDPDRPIAFHKRRSRSAHQIEKIRNQTVYCQLNHDINHSLGNLELKLHGRDWMKNVRLMISIHDVTMGGVATSFMSVDTRASWPVQCTHTVFAHDATRFGHAIFDRYVYVITVIENIQTVDTRQTMFQYMVLSSLWILTMVKLLIKWPIVVMKFLIQHRS